MRKLAMNDVSEMDDIRCVQQMGFFKLWTLRCEKGQIPVLRSFPLDDLSRSIDKIMFCAVEHTLQGYRYRIIHEGSQFVRMHGQSCVGRYVNDSVVPAIRAKALMNYDRVVRTRRPSFSKSVVRTPDGTEIQYERLLLPFARKGPSVYGIACMVSLFTVSNGFNFSDIASPHLVAIA